MKRLLGLLLVLTTSAWSQAVCPMMLFPQLSTSCGTHHATASVAAGTEGSEHPCCPRKHASHSHELSHQAKLSNGNSMVCCSVERPPATSSKTIQASPDVAVIGRVSVSESNVPSSHRWTEIADSGPPLRGVLSLKEDLRI